MKPEEKARENIDKCLSDAGWIICNRKEYEIYQSPVAIREGICENKKEADYILFIENKAVGIIEAKRYESSLDSKVEKQAEDYCYNVAKWYNPYEIPLPLVYLSNGERILFKNIRDKDSEYIELNQIHSAKDIVKILNINSEYAGLPILDNKLLRECQYHAILNLEKSLREGHTKQLLVLATGAGKTYTACMIAYRLLTYTKAKRILFLVDRNNLGAQALGEFSSFQIDKNSHKFTEIYQTKKLSNEKISNNINIAISTIQRLYSVMTGIEMDDSQDEISNLQDNIANEEVVTLGDNILLEKDFFDYIIVDECHRSIYGRWQNVLTYFDNAKIIGLTATPTPDTYAFFNKNIVAEYSLENSIRDGINVPERIYRIKTEISEYGGNIEEGQEITIHENYTNEDKEEINSEDKLYTREELNRSIIAISQIRAILTEYKEIVYTTLYPERTPDLSMIPKTLIFALNDRHAESIVQEVKKVFSGEAESFVKKITYSVDKPNELIREFRTSKEFRIAVTVNLIATGTDIKPLEVLIFMRDVDSATFYTQMIGRGVRTISDEKLQEVTPNAISKDFYYIIDTVGVTEHLKEIKQRSQAVNDVLNLTLEILLEKISHGEILDEYIKMLADKIARINTKSDNDKCLEFKRIANISISKLVENFYDAILNNTLPIYEPNGKNIERRKLVEPLSNNAKAKEYLLKLSKGFVITYDNGQDNIIYSGFSKENAQTYIATFEEYINNNKDKIEALRHIYNDNREKLTNKVLKELVNILKEESSKYTVKNLWEMYSILEPNNVKKINPNDYNLYINLINLIRFAYKHINILENKAQYRQKYFQLWIGHILKNNKIQLNDESKQLAEELADYIIHNGALEIKEIKEQGNTEIFFKTKRIFGNENIDLIFTTLSKFMLAA